MSSTGSGLGTEAIGVLKKRPGNSGGFSPETIIMIFGLVFDLDSSRPAGGDSGRRNLSFNGTLEPKCRSGSGGGSGTPQPTPRAPILNV